MTEQLDWRNQLDQGGFALIRGVFHEFELRDLIAQLNGTLAANSPDSTSIRSRQGRIYAARNFLELFPPSACVWRRSILIDVLKETLGENAGLVRGLYFDKPPDQSWSLPWHRDLTIAVRNNRIRSAQFRNATSKGGIPHVEAPRFVLEAMLTLRVHLDDATKENGALVVLPGSHRSEATDMENKCEATPIIAKAGDVLAMRPRLSHCSGVSDPDTKLHRRIIHLEFAADEQLPDGFQWHYFQSIK